MLEKLEKRLEEEKNPKQAELLQRFFKTGQGEYGEGDIFLGIKVPVQRQIVKEFNGLSIEEIQQLINSKIHEKRLIGLLILVEQYKKAEKLKDVNKKKEIFDFYLENAKQVNNWDLVDLTASNIVGKYLLDKDRKILYQLVVSSNLWEKRIAIISTFAFIREKQFEDALKIGEILLSDSHDLIHKAVGWMLREIWKKDNTIVEEFIKKNYKNMPRTSLRYTIERMEEEKRKKFLRGEFE